MNKNLVIVRAGKNSLHKVWLEMPYTQRNWDIIVSYYDESAYEEGPCGEGVKKHYCKGGKFDGLFATCEAHPQYREYEYVWLPDDDISCAGQQVNAIFSAMREYGLVLGQPSLTFDSYFTDMGVVHAPGFDLRYTNFVEIMVPCLSTELLSYVMPLFKNSMSGFGIDRVWARLIDNPKRKVGVIDKVQVHHTRPVGVFLQGKLKEMGVLPWEEEQEIFDLLNIKKIQKPVFHAGIRQNGKLVRGKVLMGFMIFGNRHLVVPKMVQDGKLYRRFRRILKWHLFYPSNFTRLFLP